MEYYYSTKERTVCDVKIEIISFVVDGSVKLTIPPNDGQSTVVNLGKKQKWCSLWCRRSQVLPDTSGQDNFQIRVVYGHYTTRGGTIRTHWNGDCLPEDFSGKNHENIAD